MIVVSTTMRIEIWSDVVCPFCFIGTSRLEQAIERFPHADEVEVVYRSFQLDPGAQERGTESVAQVLGRKYGGGEANGRALIARSVDLAAEVGLEFDYADAVHSNTLAAHRLLHLALDTGGPVLQRALKKSLLAAYFSRGEDLGDAAVLRKAAADVGVDPGRVDQVLASDDYAEAVQADLSQGLAYGATGVPFFVVDQRYGVSGAQPTEVFTQVLGRAWADTHPALDLVAEGDTCGPAGCTL